MPVTQVRQEVGGSSPSRKLLVTVEEAAELLSLSRTRMYGLLGCKRIISVKVGGVRRIPVKALHQFVETLCEVEAGEAGR